MFIPRGQIQKNGENSHFEVTFEATFEATLCVILPPMFFPFTTQKR